jgi:prevent-host-death family protein
LNIKVFIDVFCRDFYDSGMRTERVNIDQARSQLADLITFASEGGEVIIVQDGKPLARLIGATDPVVYKSLNPTPAEFSSDEESLAWDADGWEELA